MNRPPRLLALLLVLAIPISFIGRADATWGASTAVPARDAHSFVATPAAGERAGEERSETAGGLVVLDGVRWQEVFGGADRALAHQRGMNPLAWASPRALMPNLQTLLETRAVALGAPGHGGGITPTGPPFLSMPGYLEIFGGHPDPTCDSNDCARPPERTVVDDVVESSGGGDAGGGRAGRWSARGRPSPARRRRSRRD